LGFISLDFNSYKNYGTIGGCAPGAGGCHLANYTTLLCGNNPYAAACQGGSKFSVKNAPQGWTSVSPRGFAGSTDLVFSGNLTNTDTVGHRNIVLDSNSLFQFFQLGTGANSKNFIWYIGTVSSSGIITCGGISGAPTPSCLGTGIELQAPDVGTNAVHPVTVYFTGVPSGGSSAYPLTGITDAGSFYLHGIIGAGCTSLAAAGCTGQVTSIGQNEPLVVTLFMTPGSITLAPTTGVLGTTVTVTGSGFTSNTQLRFVYDGLAVTTNPSTVTTTGAGNIPASVTFTVPASAGGAHSVIVTDVTGIAARATFTVSPAPTLTLLPVVGLHGTNVVTTLTGANYGATLTYSYCLSSSSTTVSCVGSVSSFTSSAAGAIPLLTTLTANQPAGTFYVIVYNSVSNVVVVSATFTET
jgi:hypothetical protein